LERSVAAIYDEPDPGRFYAPGTRHPAVSFPEANLSRLYWHSSTPYMETIYDRQVTINLPSRQAPPGSVRHVLPNHGAGAVPYGILLTGDTQVPTGKVWQGANQATRHLSLGLSASGVWIEEVWGYSSLPARLFVGRVVLIRPATVEREAKWWYIGADKVYLGGGKFDSRRDYIKAARTSPAFWLALGRTIDTRGSGYRGVLPNGRRLDIRYSGNFAGGAFYGMDS
jgi:hypothetical protein